VSMALGVFAVSDSSRWLEVRVLEVWVLDAWGLGGWAEVRGRNLSTTCSSSETMGRWVFNADDPRKNPEGLHSMPSALPTSNLAGRGTAIPSRKIWNPTRMPAQPCFGSRPIM
jgi:hypothetical protein